MDSNDAFNLCMMSDTEIDEFMLLLQPQSLPAQELANSSSSLSLSGQSAVQPFSDLNGLHDIGLPFSKQPASHALPRDMSCALAPSALKREQSCEYVGIVSASAGSSGVDRNEDEASEGTACPGQQQRTIRKRKAAARAVLKEEVDSDDDDYMGGKGHPISHSSVEKQRRDRLNQLIEELSEQVPPSEAKYKTDGPAAVRRPKHVILSDTLTLLTLLKDKVKSCEQLLQAQRASVAASPAPTPAPAAAAPAATNPAPAFPAHVMVAQHEPLAMPLPIDANPNSTGVMVEVGLNYVWRVKVSCKGRQHQLADVTAALSGLPLAVLAASIITTPDGCMHSVFEVRVGDECVTPEAVQFAVQSAMVGMQAPPMRMRSMCSSMDMVPQAMPDFFIPDELPCMGLMQQNVPGKRARLGF